MKRFIRILFVLIIAMVFVVGCGKSEEEQERSEQPVDDTEVMNNEEDENKDIEEKDNNEDVSSSIEQELTEVTLDLTEPMEEIKKFYNSIYFSDVSIIDQEEGIIEMKVSNSIKENDFEATVSAYTIEPQARMTLVVNNGESAFEEQANKSNLSGGAMAEEVKEDVYEYADSLIWKEDGNSYRLKGGRNVLSTVKEENIEPSEDRMLFYENLAKTSNEIDSVNEFLDKVIIPTTLPSDYELTLVTIEKNIHEVMFSAYPIELVYGLKNNEGGSLYFITYGEYEDTPFLVGDGLEEIEVEGVTIQSIDDEIMFSLGEETYRIKYSDLDFDSVIEIAKSMIEKFN